MTRPPRARRPYARGLAWPVGDLPSRKTPPANFVHNPTGKPSIDVGVCSAGGKRAAPPADTVQMNYFGFSCGDFFAAAFATSNFFRHSDADSGSPRAS